MNEPLFFKKANNADGAKEFKKCLPVNVNTSFVTLAPAIATVEQQRVKPLLGAPLFDAAASYYQEHGTSGTNMPMNGLIELLQMAIVRLAYWDSFDQLAVMLADSGISDNNGENRAYRYQADALRESLHRQGFAYMNQALGHCMDHIADLPLFAQSEYYSQSTSSVIHSMKEMEAIVPLNGDFCLFARLRGYIAEIEAMELPYRVGSQLATLLMTDRTQQRLTPLLRPAQGFVAHWAMAEAMPLLNIVLTSNGPMVVSEEASSNAGKVQNPPTAQQITALTDRHRTMAERYIGQLVTFCKQHKDTYPEIAEIGLATDHEKKALFRRNKGKKTFLA